jgi:hypothetical protein
MTKHTPKTTADPEAELIVLAPTGGIRDATSAFQLAVDIAAARKGRHVRIVPDRKERRRASSRVAETGAGAPRNICRARINGGRMSPQRYGAPITILLDRIAHPAMRRLPPETAHKMALRGLNIAGALDDAAWAVLWRALVLWIVIRTRGATWARARDWVAAAIEERRTPAAPGSST